MDTDDELRLKRSSRVRRWAVLAITACLLSIGTVLMLRSGPMPPKAPPPRAGCVEQIEADGEYSCARRRDGAVLCWGTKVPGLGEVERVPRRLTAFAEPAVGLFVELRSTCITTAGGALWCLGSNYDGQLQFPASQTSSRTPSKHQLAFVDQLTWSGRCALTRADLRCWEPLETQATVVTGLPASVKMLTGGADFACVLLVTGEVWCRGANTRGQLGILEGATDAERRQFQLMGRAEFTPIHHLGSDVTWITSSRRHSCAQKADSTVWCWGENERGQIGKGEVSICGSKGTKWWVCEPEEGLVPAQVQGLPRNIVSIELGETTSCALDQHGGIWCWGSLPEPTPRAVRLHTPEPAKAIALADDACVLSTGGAVHCHPFSHTLTDWSDAVELDFGCP